MQQVIGALGGKQAGVTISGSDAYRVRMRITLPDGQQRTPEGVITILGPNAKGAFRVLAWKDEVDPNTGSTPGPAETR